MFHRLCTLIRLLFQIVENNTNTHMFGCILLLCSNLYKIKFIYELSMAAYKLGSLYAVKVRMYYDDSPLRLMGVVPHEPMRS